MLNVTKHPCENKCTEFKDEQCSTCLISCSEIPNSSDFLISDVIVFIFDADFDCLCTVTHINGTYVEATDILGNIFICDFDGIRHATTHELKAGGRIDPVALFVSDIDIHFERAIEAQGEVS